MTRRNPSELLATAGSDINLALKAIRRGAPFNGPAASLEARAINEMVASDTFGDLLRFWEQTEKGNING